MKQVILFVSLILAIQAVNAQDTLKTAPNLSKTSIDFPGAPPKYSMEYYLKKSSKSNTAAWIFLSLGSALTISGIIVYNDAMNSEDWVDGVVNAAGAEGAMVIGGSMVLGSVPFFILSHNYRKKAIQVSASLELQPYQQLNQTVLTKEYMPSLSLKINL